MTIRFIFIIIATIFLTLTSVLSSGQNPTIIIENGVIEGNQIDDISIFKGIPFAAPPVGDLRWKAPQPVQNWEGILDCTEFGASAVQPIQRPFMIWSQEFLIHNDLMSEDCLYLNVWSGATSSEEKRPVIVFIHGGGFNSGGSACPVYYGLEMAKKGVVYVSINYRVGVFGFLSHPDLTAETGTSGNYALLDMIAALKWVKTNIESFGGDPGNVSIAGSSAGAFAVNYLEVIPQAEGLFHKAIAHSGASFWSNPRRPFQTLQMAEKEGIKFATDLNTQSIKELREKSSDEIHNAKGGMRSPIIDGTIVKEDVMSVFKKGMQHDVPLLTGWTMEEIAFASNFDVETYERRANKRFGDMAETYLEMYPARTDEEVKIASIYASRDESFGFQNYTWLKMQAETGESPSFWYFFTRELPAYSTETEYGAFHTGDIPYTFNNLKLVDRPWEKTDWELSDAMSSYWANFAKTGNPNGEGLVNWGAYNSNDSNAMILGDKIEFKEHPFKQQLEFWIEYYTMLSKP